MKILLLSSVEHQSGSALRLRGIAGALARRGHEVHLMEPVPPGGDPETPAGVRRQPCPRLPGRAEWQAPLWLLHGIAAVFRVRPDTVLALKALPNVWIPSVLAGRLGARIAVDFDDLDHAYYTPGMIRGLLERFFRRAAARADDATCHNDAMRELLIRLRGRDHAPVLVDQGIDVDRFAGAEEPPAELRRRLRLGSGPVLLYAGHLGPASDLGPTLEAVARVSTGCPGANLLVVGDGRDRELLEERAQRLLPAGFAVFAGSVPHRDVPAYYSLADVALNYMEDTEANRYRASIKTREALAAGLPVVATRTTDSERFADFVRIAEPGVEAFASALRAEIAAPSRDRARAGAAWLAGHGSFDVAVRELAERWEASST